MDTGRSFKPGYGVNCVELKFQETKYGVPKGAISGNTIKQIKDIIKKVKYGLFYYY